MTIEGAVAKTMAKMGPDPYWGTGLKYYPKEIDHQTIAELIARTAR